MLQMSVKIDKKARKESPVQKPEFDKADKAKECKWHTFLKPFNHVLNNFLTTDIFLLLSFRHCCHGDR